MALRADAGVVPAIALAWMYAGCSLIGVNVPDKPLPGEALHCSSAFALATVDALTAAAGVAVGIYFDRAYAKSECCQAVQVLGIPPLLGGLVYAASAVYGYASYGRCRKLNADAYAEHAMVPSASSR